MQLRSPRAFFSTFIIAFVAAITGICGVNLVVDPFWRFNLVNIEGLNAQRNQIPSYARLAKPGIVCRMQPTKIIIGTSRDEVGLPPTHPAFSQIPGATYNLSLAGMGMKEMEQTLKHAKYASPGLKEAVVGLDFLMFNANREAVVFGTEVLAFDAGRLLASPQQSCFDNLRHDFSSFLWLKGVGYARDTVKLQVTKEPDVVANRSEYIRWLNLYDANGYRGDFFSIVSREIRIKSHRALIDGDDGRSATQEKYYATRVWRPPPSGRYCFAAPGQPNTLDVLRDIVRFGYENGINIRFIINPIHARMLHAIWQIGLWPTYEDWKRGLVNVIEGEAKSRGTAPFALWDFSGINSVTTEKIPPLGDTSQQMRWFWEPSHFTANAGNLMFDRIYDYHRDGIQIPDDFGRRLTSDTVEPWIEETRAGLGRYAAAEPDETRLVDESLAPVMKDAVGANCGEDIQGLIAGSDALSRGDGVAAATAFAQARAWHDADRDRYAAIGAPYREAGFDKFLQAAEAGQRIELPLTDWTTYQARGAQRLRDGDNKGALADFTQAILLGPSNTALLFQRGTTRLALADNQGALEDFDAALKIEPNNKTLQSLRQQAAAGLKRQADEKALKN